MYAPTYTQLDSNLITRTTGERQASTLSVVSILPRGFVTTRLRRTQIPCDGRLESDEKLSSGTFAGMRKMREVDYPRSKTRPLIPNLSPTLSLLFPLPNSFPGAEKRGMRNEAHSSLSKTKQLRRAEAEVSLGVARGVVTLLRL